MADVTKAIKTASLYKLRYVMTAICDDNEVVQSLVRQYIGDPSDVKVKPEPEDATASSSKVSRLPGPGHMSPVSSGSPADPAPPGSPSSPVEAASYGGSKRKATVGVEPKGTHARKRRMGLKQRAQSNTENIIKKLLLDVENADRRIDKMTYRLHDEDTTASVKQTLPKLISKACKERQGLRQTLEALLEDKE